MKQLLSFLEKIKYPIYENKIIGKGFSNTLLNDAITQGYIKKIDIGHSEYMGVEITDAGRNQLIVLNQPPAPTPPSEKEVKIQQLKSKLTDGSITIDEIKEFLKLVYT